MEEVSALVSECFFAREVRTIGRLRHHDQVATPCRPKYYLVLEILQISLSVARSASEAWPSTWRFPALPSDPIVLDEDDHIR